MKTAALALAALTLGCSAHTTPVPAAPLTPPTELCRATSKRACRSPAEVERWLTDPGLEILGVSDPPAGRQGVQVLTLRAPLTPPVVFRAKWRAQATQSSNSDPRLELAAYGLQKVFLDPPEYVVPPSAVHCFPLEKFRAAVDRTARPSYQTSCVAGILSYWLEDVQSISSAKDEGWFRGDPHILDRDLFAKNPVYRDSVASVNLLTHLIQHGDTHAKNFVITKDRGAPVIYSVDNSLSMGIDWNSRLDDPEDWSGIKVPGLRRKDIERLRAGKDKLAALAWLAELELRDGILVSVPRSITTPTVTGLGWLGDRLRFGLNIAEIEAIKARVNDLLHRVDAGEIAVF